VRSGELVERHAQNPILSAADWPYAGNAIFNPAAAVVGGVEIHDESIGELRSYCGSADTTAVLATTQRDDVLAAVLAAPA
jgi:predicted GH43/DUF377 family glycosyl hydrolase